MADILVENVARLDILEGYSNVTKAQNSIYLRKATGWTSANLEAILAATEAAWTDNLAAVKQSATVYEGARIRDIGVSPYGPIFEELAVPTVPGTLAGDADPSWVCGVVQMLGTPGDDPRRSYIRFMGLGDSQVSGNAVDTGSRATIKAAFDAFVSDLQAAGVGIEHVIISKILDGAPRSPGVASAVTATAVRAQMGRAISRYGVRP